MSPKAGSGLRIVDHRYGTLLRFRAKQSHATDAALDLLGLLQAELDAEVEGMRKQALKAGTPVLIQLESLGVELTAEGNEIVVSRATGSEHEFEELCEFICGRQNPA